MNQRIQPLYFINAPVDFFFVGGASILCFALFSLFYTEARTPEVIAAGAFLMWIINWPHFSMTSYRLYQSKTNIQQYPVTAFIIPVVVLVGVLASFASPDQVAPYFIKLFLIWSPYHFSGQTVGITLIYARRSGFKVGKIERLALSTFVFGTFILSTLRAEVSRDGYQFYGIRYPGIGVPQWMVTVSEFMMWAAAGVFALAVIGWCYRQRRMIPPIVLLVPITQYVWFVQSIYMPSFQEFVPMFHSLQYMLIAWGMQIKEKMDLNQIEPSKRYVLTETARWGVINFIGGVILFFALPRLGTFMGYSLFFSTGVVIAGVQIHHFFVDGVIWKLKKQTVSHPLMMNLRDVVSRA